MQPAEPKVHPSLAVLGSVLAAIIAKCPACISLMTGTFGAGIADRLPAGTISLFARDAHGQCRTDVSPEKTLDSCACDTRRILR